VQLRNIGVLQGLRLRWKHKQRLGDYIGLNRANRLQCNESGDDNESQGGR
jgi:hypothetical protein